MKITPEKRAGRQSAQAAAATRAQIIQVAGEQFCKQGYSKTSLRGISEQAGVTHSLIRHHFGSKLSIWQHICDNIQSQFHADLQQLLLNLDTNMPSNQRLFRMLLTLLAKLLLDPRPVKLLTDAIKQHEELFDYFMDDVERRHNIIEDILQQCQQDGYLRNMTIKELKWSIIIFADTALSLSPLMEKTYPKCSDRTACLLAHWQLYAKLLAAQLAISETDIPQPNSLKELLEETQTNSHFSCPESGNDPE